MIPVHSEQIIARTIKEFCRAYGVGHTKAYELIAQGKVEARKAGRRTLITEASARKWLEECEETKEIEKKQKSALAVWEEKLNSISPGGPTQLYRHYDKNNVLLYVGISLSAVVRLIGHHAAPWIEEITRVEIQHFPSRRAARVAERRAIESEGPLHNNQFSQSYPCSDPGAKPRITANGEEQQRKRQYHKSRAPKGFPQKCTDKRTNANGSGG